MASAGHLTVKGSSSGQNFDEEFPILCETCLGENPYVRMTKEPFGKACKICDRPFTIYRWRPGPRARYKKTELCHTCAKLKNVCQTCVLDLEYGLPVQVRDSTLEEHEKLNTPKSDVTLGYMIEQAEREMGTVGGVGVGVGAGAGGAGGEYGKAMEPSKLLQRLARRTPYYRRNLPHVCSFFAKGECNRGASCPYRHEMPLTGELANQNIKDRFYGQNDPVANKMMRRATHDPVPLSMPEDKTITTLWVGGVMPQVPEEDLRAKFASFGVLSSLKMVAQKNCAFVTFAQRAACEEAAKNLHNRLQINGHHMRLAWGQRKGGSDQKSGSASSTSLQGSAPSAPSFPAAMPLPGTQGGFAYPSMDPRNMSTRLPTGL